MDLKEPARPALHRHRQPKSWASFILLAAGLTSVGAAFVTYSLSGADPAPEKKPPTGAAWNYEELFPNWPKDRKPDFVIVVTGQTYGYLQKCGCSDPQKGGLERRFNFLEGFKALGIEAIPIDLGDVTPPMTEDSNKIIPDQAKLKYLVAMRTMKAMGYRVVGLGKEEFALGLDKALGEFGGQPGNDRPRMLAANVIGFRAGKDVLPKQVAFPNGANTDTAVGDWDVIPTASKINLGVVGIIGRPVIQEMDKLDKSIVFADAKQSEDIVKKALKEMDNSKTRPNLNVLLYTGPILQATAAAQMFPQFRIVVCSSEESEPPNVPTMANPAQPDSAMIVRVGHKGQNLGVIGVFKKGKGYELMYQRISLSPEFETPAGQEGTNIALKELEWYSKTVKERGLLTRNRKSPHPLQITNPNASYVGSQACAACHQNHGNADVVWNGSKHAAAYNALVNIASKPSLRQFDAECIRCHTVGFDFKTGYVNEEKTPLLKNVGCESCHGPGSQHVALPNNKALALELSPWKIDGKGQMPDAAALKQFMEERDPAKRQKIISPVQQNFVNRVDRTCQTCHNTENDPHFQIEAYWPKIAHSLKPAKNVPPMVQQNEAKEKEIGPALEPMTLPK